MTDQQIETLRRELFSNPVQLSSRTCAKPIDWLDRWIGAIVHKISTATCMWRSATAMPSLLRRRCISEGAMANVKMIEDTLATLANERDKLLQQQAQHTDKMNALAFDAHGVGDVDATKKLQALQREAVWTQGQIGSIDAAIAEGQRRLAIARGIEQKERDREKAEALRPVLQSLSQPAKLATRPWPN